MINDARSTVIYRIKQKKLNYGACALFSCKTLFAIRLIYAFHQQIYIQGQKKVYTF